jgi:hypothetical protein
MPAVQVLTLPLCWLKYTGGRVPRQMSGCSPYPCKYVSDAPVAAVRKVFYSVQQQVRGFVILGAFQDLPPRAREYDVVEVGPKLRGCSVVHLGCHPGSLLTSGLVRGGSLSLQNTPEPAESTRAAATIVKEFANLASKRRPAIFTCLRITHPPGLSSRVAAYRSSVVYRRRPSVYSGLTVYHACHDNLRPPTSSAWRDPRTSQPVCAQTSWAVA